MDHVTRWLTTSQLRRATQIADERGWSRLLDQRGLDQLSEAGRHLICATWPFGPDGGRRTDLLLAVVDEHGRCHAQRAVLDLPDSVYRGALTATVRTSATIHLDAAPR